MLQFRKIKYIEIPGSHGGEHEDESLLGYSALMIHIHKIHC
jgi:hypothetical protein